MSRDRSAARRRGQRAEFLACLFLIAKGYRILARGFSARGGEIDIIAQRGKVIAFVEVKRRNDIETALRAIDGTKQARFSRAAAFWLSGHNLHENFTFRADALCLAPWVWPRHLPGAFELQIW